MKLKVLIVFYAICGFKMFQGLSIQQFPLFPISQQDLQVDLPLVLSL